MVTPLWSKEDAGCKSSLLHEGVTISFLVSVHCQPVYFLYKIRPTLPSLYDSTFQLFSQNSIWTLIYFFKNCFFNLARILIPFSSMY